jgi:TonB family protein
VKTLDIAAYVLAAVALLPPAFSQELLKLAPFGRPIAVMDDGDNWSIPISLYSDSEVEIFVPDITTEGWISWHVKQFRETGKYGVYVYAFYKNDQLCRRERIPAEHEMDPKWLEGCGALRYQRKLVEVDTRKNTVRVYSALVMQKDAVANPTNQKVFNEVFPLAKLDYSQRQAYQRLSGIVTREMNEYKGLSVEQVLKQNSKVVSSMIENLSNAEVCPETGRLVNVPLGHAVWDSPDCPPTTPAEKMLSSPPATPTSATKPQLQVAGANKDTGVYEIGGDVSPPRGLYTPDPTYSKEALQARLQGKCTLRLILGPDGKPRDITVQRRLGLGLDEKAFETVSTWRFEPAMKDGKPVPVQINVDVEFRLPN